MSNWFFCVVTGGLVYETSIRATSQWTFVFHYQNVVFQAKEKAFCRRIFVSNRRTSELSFFYLPESEMIDITVDKDSINGSLLFENREKVLCP